MKPRVAFFEFSSCEGCQLTVLNCEEELLTLVGSVEIVNFREAMSEPHLNEYEIAFVEGSIVRESEIARLNQIRANSKILIALGSCAHIGCVNVYKNRFSESENREVVYDHQKYYPKDVTDTIPAQPISKFVKVDFTVPGCPIDKKEFLTIVRSLLEGRTPTLPDYAVCVDCRLAENGCLLMQSQPCMGPVSRSGCKAICPTFGSLCWGCRGVVPDSNVEGHHFALRRQGIDEKTIDRIYQIFQSQEFEGKR